MKFVEQCYKVLDTPPVTLDLLDQVEFAAKICTGANLCTSRYDQYKFLEGLLKRGETSPFEHASFSVLFTVDRGISHELVRNDASFNQESTRYIDYTSEVRDFYFIEPLNLPLKSKDSFEQLCWRSELTYRNMIENGAEPEDARDVLPTCFATHLLMTGNIKQWRRFFSQRVHETAHKKCRQLLIPLLLEMRSKLPVVFDDISFNEVDYYGY